MFASLRHPATRLASCRPFATRVPAAQAAAKPIPTPRDGEQPTPTPPAQHGTPAAHDVERPIHIPPAEDPLLQLFTSMVMRDGKRQQAAHVVSQTLLHIHAFTRAPPLPILRAAVDAGAPLLRCRSFKRAAKQYVFPIPLTERQRAWHALRWIRDASKAHLRSGKHLPERLAREIIAIVRGEQTETIKNKLAAHKLAVLHRGNVLRPPNVPRSNRG